MEITEERIRVIVKEEIESRLKISKDVDLKVLEQLTGYKLSGLMDSSKDND